MSDEYQGWSNRETWSVDVTLSNDEGLYRRTIGIAARAYREAAEFAEEHGVDTPNFSRWIGEAIRDEVWAKLEDLAESNEEAGRIVRSAGSPWRINWDEIGEAWLPENTEGANE